MADELELWLKVEAKLEKHKRMYRPVNIRHLSHRVVELFCEKCGKSLGDYDILGKNLERNRYCIDCMKEYIKPIPYESTAGVVVEDRGDVVVLQKKRDEHKGAIICRTCYFNTKGRYIVIDGKGYYI